MSSTITGSATSPVSSLQSRCGSLPAFSLCGCSAPSISSGSFSLASTWLSSSNVSWYVASPITAPQSGQLSPPVWPQALQAISGSCCTTGSGWFISGLVFSVSGWFWYTQSRVWIPFTHFGSFGSLIPSTNSPRDAASNLSASTGFFDGMFFRASWSSARSSWYFASTEFTCDWASCGCVSWWCSVASGSIVSASPCSTAVVPDGCGFSSSSCFPSSVTRCGIGAEERPQAISTISGSGLAWSVSVSTLFRYSVTCAGMTSIPIGASFTDATTMARE